MKYLMSILTLLTVFLLMSFNVSAQLLEPKTDLVIMIIWQAEDGTITDKRYVRHTEASEAACIDARGNARLVWSARKNSNMLGQSICLAPSQAVPTLTIGTFKVIVDSAVEPGS